MMPECHIIIPPTRQAGVVAVAARQLLHCLNATYQAMLSSKPLTSRSRKLRAMQGSGI